MSKLGNEFDATYPNESPSVYTFKTSDIKTLLPSLISTSLLVTVLIFLLISYNWLGSWIKLLICLDMIWFELKSTDSTSPLATTTCSFLFKIVNLSPTLIFDLSIGALNEKVVPDISTWNLELVLYFQELANISL